MKPGIYRLTKTITNPNADRRKTRDWTLSPEWQEGRHFVIQNDDNVRAQAGQPRCMVISQFDGASKSLLSAYFVADGDRAHPAKSVSSARERASASIVELLLPALEPSTDPEHAFCQLFFDTWDEPRDASMRVLLALFEGGKATAEDITGVLKTRIGGS